MPRQEGGDATNQPSPHRWAGAGEASSERQRETVRRRRPANTVPIQSQTIAELNAHMEKLESYVTAFLTFKKLREMCESARAVCEDPDRRARPAGPQRRQYLDEIRAEFEDIDQVFDAPDFWKPDFGDPLSAFRSAIAEAVRVVGADGPLRVATTMEDFDQVMMSLEKCLADMLTAARAIIKTSEPGAEKELMALKVYVKDIFGKVKPRTGETEGGNVTQLPSRFAGQLEEPAQGPTLGPPRPREETNQPTPVRVARQGSDV